MEPGGFATLAASGRERALWMAGGLLLVLVLAVFLFAPAWTQHPNIPVQQEMAGMDDMSDMAGMAAMPEMQHSAAVAEPTPQVLAKQLADKRESEFNHHLAGAMLILAALFFLGQERLARRWAAANYAG